MTFLILGLSLSSIGLVQAQVTSLNGQIAYTVCEFVSGSSSTQCDIWIMEADGTGQINVTNTLDLNEISPAWAPDGIRIAFMEDRGGANRLAVINSDGSGRTIVTQEASVQFGPTWSPGGTQIALVRQLPGEEISIQFDIVVLNADGSGEINITNSDYDELEPEWAPDGSKIAFAGVRPEWTLDFDTGEPALEAQWEIVSINPDGSEEQILSAGDAETPRATSLEEDRSPSWSPDSSRLVFASQNVDPCCDNWKILIVNRDGSNTILLSDNPAVNDFAPSFSPDGADIIFTSDRDATVGGQFDIFRIPVPANRTSPDIVATRLTTSGNSGQADWGRNKNALPETQDYSLFLSIAHQAKGKGGKIKITPKGNKCGKRCTPTFANGTQVTLTARPKKGFAFSGWSGACATAATQLTCTIIMDDAKVVEALFLRTP